MSQSQDICRANRIIASGQRSSTAVGCNIDRSDLPPPGSAECADVCFLTSHIQSIRQWHHEWFLEEN